MNTTQNNLSPEVESTNTQSSPPSVPTSSPESDEEESSMRKNKRMPVIGSIVVLFIVIAVASIFFFQRQKPEPIIIGALLAMTGAGGDSGRLLLDGINLVIDDLNARGGLNGRQVELVVKDTETDAELAKKLFLEMEEELQPLLYFSYSSRIGVAIGPLAEEAEVPLLVLLATSPKVVEDKKWVFKFPQSTNAEVPAALFHFENLEVKRLGLLYLNDAFGRSVFEAVGPAFEEVGGDLTSISFESDELDFHDYVAKLKDTDAIYFVGLQAHRRAFYSQSAEFDYTGYMIGESGVSGERDLEGTEGVYVATPGLHNPNNIFSRETGKLYEEAYNEPMDFRGASGYDGMRIIATLLEGEELTRENIREVLDNGFTYSGVWGVMTVQPGDHDFIGPLLPAQIVDGEFNFLE